MKIILLSTSVIVLFTCSPCWGQNTFPSSGNVGIGTMSPSAPLEVNANGSNPAVLVFGNENTHRDIRTQNTTNGKLWQWSHRSVTAESENFEAWHNNGSAWTRVLAMTPGGRVGIGTASPAHTFVTHVGTDLNWGITTGTSGLYPALRAMNDAANGWIQGEIDASVLTLNAASGGNVAIGTTDPQGYKLAVNGSAIATSMRVKAHANWPDYVFDAGHHMLSLGELATYIKQNRHLPEIPSAADVEKNGIELGEMNAKLLKKIEELTLYLIAKEEEMAEVKARLQKLESKSK